MKILKKILFVLLCIMIFASCYFLGARTGMQKFINDKFASMMLYVTTPFQIGRILGFRSEKYWI